MQIVAVVFAKFKSHQLIFGEKPYFYIDPHGCKVDDLALSFVSADRGCAIVRVVREAVDDAAAMYVTKPLLCKIDYDPDVLKDIQDRIDEFKKKTQEHRVQRDIDARIREARGEPANTFLENPVTSPRFTLRIDKTKGKDVYQPPNATDDDISY